MEPRRAASPSDGVSRAWVAVVLVAVTSTFAHAAESPGRIGNAGAPASSRDVAPEIGSFWSKASVERYLVGRGRLVISEEPEKPSVAVCIAAPRRDDDPSSSLAAEAERRGGFVDVTSGANDSVWCATLPKSELALGVRLAEERLSSAPRPGATPAPSGDAQPIRERRATALALEGTVASGAPPPDFVIGVTGGARAADVVARVERVAGARATPAEGVARPSLGVNQSSERLSVVEEPAPAPRARYGWITGASGAENRAALDVLVGVLAGGPSSRLHRDLVERRFLAHYVSAWSSTLQGGVLLGVDFEISTRTTLDRARRFVDGAIRQLRLVGPSRGELRRARRRLELDALLEWENPTDRCRRLTRSELGHGDARAWLEELRALGSITEESVRRAAHDTLVDSRRVTVEAYPPRWPEDDPKLADYRVYAAAAGESLAGIAERFGVTVQALAKANDLDPRYGLVADQPLLIPPPR